MSIRFQNVAAAGGPTGERTRIQLCGRLSVEIDGAQLAGSLRGKQVPVLLAYLVLNRDRHVGREELIGVLWPGRAPRSEDASLRTLLSRLRSSLGGSILGGRDELRLELPEPAWIDFEAARAEAERALQALESGDPRGAWALAQVPLNIASRGLLPGTQGDWLEPRRHELEDIRLQALEVIGRAGLQLGGPQVASVQRAAQNLIDSEPYRESGYVLLMEALAAEGNVAEGLRVFERLRALLRDELGTMPSPETIAAHERLLHPSGRRGAGAARAAPGRERIELPPELHARASTPLIGRRRETSELRRLWRAATEPGEEPAEGRLVLLYGEAGMGKTSLIGELARALHDEGAFVLAGRSPEENVVPYQPFLEALRHYVVNVPFADLRANAREFGSELARLVPEIRRRVPQLPAADDGEPETERYRLFEAVVGLFAEMSMTAPVLLVLDDLHWLDRPSLMLLRHLARTPGSSRVLILGAFRADESGREFADAVSDLRRERLVTQLEIGGLSERETAELVRLRSGAAPSRAFSLALYKQTEGNPFFVEETVRHLQEAGVVIEGAPASALQGVGLPEGIKNLIARRLDRLDPAAIEWLRVAAVIGRDFDADLLQRVAAIDEEQFFTGLEEALAAGLVVEAPASPRRYSFSHALIRETLYEGMSTPRRASIHRRVGEALEDIAERTRSPNDRRRGGAVERTLREPHLPELAHHFTRAAGEQDALKAIRYALRAGQQASAMLAHEDAADHYARALEVLHRFDADNDTRRCELLLLMGESMVRAGERQMAWETFREAAAVAARLNDGASVARAAIGAARGYIQPPGVIDTELIGMLELALEMTADEQSLRRVQLLARMCGALYYTPERDRILALSEEAVGTAERLGDPEARATACAARRRALWHVDRLQERLETSTEMLTLARQIGNLELELQAHAWLVVDLLEHGDRDAVDAQIDAFSLGAERSRQPLYIWNAIVWRAMRALLAGELETAVALAGEALEAGSPVESVTAPQYYAIQLLATRREQLRMGELEDAARRFVEANPDRPAWRAALAVLLCEDGRLDAARAEHELLAASGYADVPRDGDWMTAITLLSDVCVAVGDSARARLLYEQLSPYAGTNVVIGLAAVCYGSTDRYLARLAATLGDDAVARAHFERALDANRRLTAPVCLAHTQLDYAGVLGPASRQGRELIGAALEAAQRLNLPLVARRAQELGKR